MIQFLREHRYWMLVVTLVSALSICIADTVAATLDVRLTLSAITAQWAATHVIGVFCIALALWILFGHLFWFQVVTVYVPR